MLCADVAPQQDQIIEVFVLPDDAALDLILDDSLAGLRGPQPDRGLHALRRLGRIAIPP